MTVQNRGSPAGVRFALATRREWASIEDLFGARGACGGCWCMWFRLPRAPYEAGKGDANRALFQERVAARDLPAPGILAFRDEAAIGWCAVAPREEYLRLRTTRTMRGPDDLDVWAILCLFVAPAERKSGLSVHLIDAACGHAFRHGAPAVEAYPIIPRRAEVPAVFASQGLLSAYRAAGFEVVDRPSDARAVVRRHAPG